MEIRERIVAFDACLEHVPHLEDLCTVLSSEESLSHHSPRNLMGVLVRVAFLQYIERASLTAAPLVNSDLLQSLREVKEMYGVENTAETAVPHSLAEVLPGDD